jgi:hypothetical protein
MPIDWSLSVPCGEGMCDYCRTPWCPCRCHKPAPEPPRLSTTCDCAITFPSYPIGRSEPHLPGCPVGERDRQRASLLTRIAIVREGIMAGDDLTSPDNVACLVGVLDDCIYALGGVPPRDSALTEGAET